MSEYHQRLLQALRKRSRAPNDPTDEQVNGKRIAAGRTLMKFYAETALEREVGEKLLERYLAIPGRGDEYDFRSTGVDAMTDILHFARQRGISKDDVVKAIQDGSEDLETEGIAYAIHDICSALTKAGHDFTSALEMAYQHVGAEKPAQRTF
jgi:hypothetical protein